MKILLVDDHTAVREGVRNVLASEDDISLIDAQSSEEALELWARERPDVVILDINLGASSGLELLRHLVRSRKTAKVLVLSMYFGRIYAASVLRAGALGYVSKGARPEELLDAVRQVGAGRRYVERDLATELALGKLLNNPNLDDLTTREIDLLRLLREGKGYEQIAATIGLSSKTVANAIMALRKKLMVETTADLLALSAERLNR